MAGPGALPVFINAGGGTVKKLGPDKQIELIETSFARHGRRVRVEALDGDALGEAIERSDGPLAVGGGDGTIALAAGKLVGGGRQLGVLPLGTLNHFAKDLGLADLDGAVDAICAGQTRDVDVGEVCDRVFINNSSIGFYPAMVAERTREQEASGLPKWPAMALAALRTLKRFPRHRLTIAVEGREAPCVTPCLFIGNNRYTLSGADIGGREGALDDGSLTLVVIRGATLWSLAALSLRAAFGRLPQADDVEVIEGVKSIRIDSHSNDLQVSLDGEVAHMTAPLDYRIREKALRVYAPA